MIRKSLAARIWNMLISSITKRAVEEMIMSYTAPDLKKIFGQYTGQTLKNPNRLTCDVDTVLEGIKATADQHKLGLRVMYPGHRFTQEVNLNRVKVRVQDDGGVLKVSGFSIG